MPLEAVSQIEGIRVVEDRPEPRPEPHSRDLLPAEDYARVLRAAVLPHLRDDVERATIVVRASVSFEEVEIFLGRRVEGMSRQKIQSAVDHGALDTFAQGLLARLRSRQFVGYAGARRDVYHLDQMLREVNSALWQVLRAGTKNATELRLVHEECHRIVRERLPSLPGRLLVTTDPERDAEGRVLRWPSVEELSVANRVLQDLVAKNFSWKTIPETVEGWEAIESRAPRKRVKRTSRKNG